MGAHVPALGVVCTRASSDLKVEDTYAFIAFFAFIAFGAAFAAFIALAIAVRVFGRAAGHWVREH